MSVAPSMKRLTAPAIMARKGGEPLVVLTAYHTYMAKIIDAACDILLVGDSLGMVSHGLDTTVPVSLDMMIAHGQAVVHGSKHALVVVDMPFGSYERSKEDAFSSAVRVMKETGCGAIKLEGGVHMAQTVSFLVQRGIPVLAHVGMTPQAINTLGSFKARGRTQGEWPQILADAHAVADAGAFAVVVEAVAEPLAREITAQIAIPTIGIGASSACDGQVLVLEDMLGFTERVPPFVKRYADLKTIITQAVEAYAGDVRARTFPSQEHTYALKEPS